MKQSRQDRAIHASYSNRMQFTKENVAKVPDVSGTYKFFDKNGKLIYIGVSKNGKHSGLRHRLQSYYQKDDFSEHKTKTWRTRIRSFEIRKENISSARKEEKRIKQKTPYNADNKNHHLHR